MGLEIYGPFLYFFRNYLYLLAGYTILIVRAGGSCLALRLSDLSRCLYSTVKEAILTAIDLGEIKCQSIRRRRGKVFINFLVTC